MFVIGPGGARMDFVAGWLGLLPNFIDNHWVMDPLTHQSHGSMRFAKQLDYRDDFDAIWPKHFTLSADADLYLTGTGHGTNLNVLQEQIDSGAVKLLTIDTRSPAINTNKIKWEWTTKTYLSREKPSFYRALKGKWLIDEDLKKDNPRLEVTDKERIFAIDQKLKTPIGNFYNQQTIHPMSIIADYNLLFQPGGSRYLCQQLNLTADESYHQYWDHMLPLADAPTTITVWGHTWRYKDYFRN